MIVVYVTFPDLESARAISESLIRERLAACANIFSPHIAFYWWEGGIQNAQEVTVLYKTRTDLFEKLQSSIKAQHPYDCPCIVYWPLAGGNPEFMQWIETETTKEVF